MQGLMSLKATMNLSEDAGRGGIAPFSVEFADWSSS